MQYVWQHGLFPPSGLSTVDGRRVVVIDRGQLNTASGPDFFNAKVKIDNRLWVGDVEIHVRASDWHRHGHDADPAYDSVILHVVGRDDTPIARRNGELIPQLALPCSPDLGTHYGRLTDMAPGPVLGCRDVIPQMPPLYLTDWIASLALERMHQKAERIAGLLTSLAGDRAQTAFVTLARALGFGLNGEPFELLAKSLPLRLLFKHSDSVTALEALLFGQSGLLPPEPQGAAGPYVERLAAEYAFLTQKYGLRRPEGMQWKLSGMRPPQFPHRRIALLAAMVHNGVTFASELSEAATAESMERLFSVELSGYWSNHYTFGPHTAASTPSALSQSSIRTLMINVQAPMMLAFGLERGNFDVTEQAVAMLESLPPERNSIITLFADAGIKARNAMESQALIQLRRAYCEARKCLYCRIGHRMLASRAVDAHQMRR